MSTLSRLYDQFKFKKNILILDRSRKTWVKNDPDSWFSFIKTYSPRGSWPEIYISHEVYKKRMGNTYPNLYVNSTKLVDSLRRMETYEQSSFVGKRRVLDDPFSINIPDPFGMLATTLLSNPHVIAIIDKALDALRKSTDANWGIAHANKSGGYLEVTFISERYSHVWMTVEQIIIKKSK